MFRACKDEINVLSTYKQALEADILNAERGFTSLACAARKILRSPDVAFSAIATTSPLMTGNLDKSFLDSLRCGLLPYASWDAITALQAHVPSLTPEHMDIFNALKAGNLPIPDHAVHLDSLVSTVRANLNFMQMVSVTFDYGTIVRNLASCVLEAPYSSFDAAL